MPDARSRLGIVVGVDGSLSSMAAVRWAAREATMRNVSLTLVHARSRPAVGPPILATHPQPLSADSFEQLEQRVRHLLSDAIKIAEDNAVGGKSPQITTEVLTSSPSAALVEQSKSAEMVVVGSCGQSTWRRALLGSVSTALVHHAQCPVAVIHDDLTPLHQRTNWPVLVGIDGSPASEQAIAIAFDEASWRDSGWWPFTPSMTPTCHTSRAGKMVGTDSASRGEGGPCAAPSRLAGTLSRRYCWSSDRLGSACSPPSRQKSIRSARRGW